MHEMLRLLYHVGRNARTSLRNALLGENYAEMRRLQRAGRVTIGPGTYGWPRIWTDVNGHECLRVGNYSSLNGTYLLGGRHGDNFVTTYPHRINWKMPGAGEDGFPTPTGDTIVGSDVWTCEDSLILSGVKIGDGAIVAAGAVVDQRRSAVCDRRRQPSPTDPLPLQRGRRSQPCSRSDGGTGQRQRCARLSRCLPAQTSTRSSRMRAVRRSSHRRRDALDVLPLASAASRSTRCIRSALCDERSAWFRRRRPVRHRSSRGCRGDSSCSVHESDAIGYSILVGRVFDPCVTETIHRLIEPGDVIIDVGANVGYLTSLAAVRAGRAGRVIAVEPHPTVFELLRANVESWRGKPGLAPVELHQLALSDHAGRGRSCQARCSATTWAWRPWSTGRSHPLPGSRPTTWSCGASTSWLARPRSAC